MEFPVLYTMEPIGVDGALEAVDVIWFGSETCRNLYRVTEMIPDDVELAEGMNGDCEDGTVCEYCCEPIRAHDVEVTP